MLGKISAGEDGKIHSPTFPISDKSCITTSSEDWMNSSQGTLPRQSPIWYSPTLAVKARSRASALKNSHSSRLRFTQHLTQAFFHLRAIPWRSQKGGVHEIISTWGDVIQKTNDYAEPRFAGGGRETGTGHQSWTEVISGSKIIAGFLTSGYSQRFTRALQRKAAHFWPAYCALLVHHFHNHLDLHICIMSHAFCLPLPTELCLPMLYVKVCQKRRKDILYLMHSKHFHRSCGSTIW